MREGGLDEERAIGWMETRPDAPDRAGSSRARAASTVVQVAAAALTGSALAIFLGLLLAPLLPHSRLVVFYVGVIVATWLGGVRAGIVALVICGIAAEYLVMESPGRLQLTGAAIVRLVTWAVVAGGMIAVVGMVQRARGAAERNEAGARALAQQLEEQAVELETQVTESQELANEFQRVNEQLRTKTEEAERVTLRTRRLQSTVGALLRTITPQQVGRVMMEEGLVTLEARAGVLGVLAPDTNTIRISAARGIPAEWLERARVLPLDAPVAIPVAIRTGEPVWLPRGSAGGPLPVPSGDGQSEAANGNAVSTESPAIDAGWAVLPLHGRERVLGAIALGFDRDGEFGEEEKTLMLLLAQECGQALERARLYEAERNARVKAEFAERRISFLAEASTRLAESLDYNTTLAGLARLAVPEIADWCAIHLVDEQGALRLLAAEHMDANSLELLRDMLRRYPPRAFTMGAGRVHHTGAAELLRDITPDTLAEGAWDDEHLAMLRRLEPRSEICVPMIARDVVLGTITLVSSRSGRRYTPADLALAEELATRAAQAIENARLFEDTRSASQAKSDFLAVMSHELRTPLNAILGYADLVLLGVPGSVPDKTRDYVERIRGAAHDLLRLVEEVLTFARLESGKEKLRTEILDVNAAVREAIALLEPAATQKGIRIAFELPDTGVEIESDASKLRQILYNVLSNAVKFTQQGVVRVSLATEPSGVRVVVRDTGIGIPREHIEQIFAPFWQVEQTSTRRFGGAGLGLGVARELARLLGGDLTAESEVGVGSTFTLRLPVRRTRDSRRHA
jgi:signal transduction histidine kinase